MGRGQANWFRHRASGEYLPYGHRLLVEQREEEILVLLEKQKKKPLSVRQDTILAGLLRQRRESEDG